MGLTTRRVEVAPGVGLACTLLEGEPGRQAATGAASSTDERAGAASADPSTRSASPGRTFVCVHGLASNARLWDQMAFTLAALGHDVVALDLRGHGRSDKPDEGYDTPTVAEDVARVIEALALDRSVVIGQSWGANVAVELAWRRGDLVAGIVCVDGGTIDLQSRFTSWEECARVLAPPRLGGTPEAQVRTWMREAHPDWTEAGIEATLANFDVRADGTVTPWLTLERHLRVLRGMWEHHPAERFPGIGVPVLFVPAVGPVGSEDDGDAVDRRGPVSRHDLEAALSTIPIADVAPMVGDHDLHAQHPRELAHLLHKRTSTGFFG